MATDQVVTYSINVNPISGSGTSSAVKIETVDRTLLDFKNIIIQNVASLMGAKQEKALTTNIQKVFTKIVDQELARMGRQINQLAVGLNNNQAFTKTANPSAGGAKYLMQPSGPKGTLSITGTISKAMTGLTSPVTLVSGTGLWAARNADYLRRRKAEGTGTKWFKRTGELGKYLANPATYTQAYGPVKVSYTKARKGAPIPNVVGISNIGTGVPGRKSGVGIRLGTLEVSVLGRISSDMLNDPGQRQPSPWNTGLFGSLNERMEEKLLNTQERYRSFLEHFLSFYLTRSIPNAIFRKIEQISGNALKREITQG